MLASPNQAEEKSTAKLEGGREGRRGEDVSDTMTHISICTLKIENKCSLPLLPPSLLPFPLTSLDATRTTGAAPVLVCPGRERREERQRVTSCKSHVLITPLIAGVNSGRTLKGER